MKLGRLNHVGVVTPSIDRATGFYRDVMGARTIRPRITTADGAVAISFVETPNSLIELIEPLTEGTDVADFLRAHPEGGQHHLCFEVEDIQQAWDWFAARGASFACPIVPGVLGYPIFFIAAASMGGTLTEIIEIRP
jgi:methylmalonyl-CoA/ethylmalonyl-CoA epimerase